MKLVALSRRDWEARVVTEPSIAILIAYPTGRLHYATEGGDLCGVLHLRFSDCDEKGAWAFPDRKDPNLKAVPMTRGAAVDILDFVEKWRSEVGTIYAACYGGVSRSRGVLAGLAAVYGWEDNELYAEGHPNAWVKTLIIREATERRYK